MYGWPSTVTFQEVERIFSAHKLIRTHFLFRLLLTTSELPEKHLIRVGRAHTHTLIFIFALSFKIIDIAEINLTYREKNYTSFVSDWTGCGCGCGCGCGDGGPGIPGTLGTMVTGLTSWQQRYRDRSGQGKLVFGIKKAGGITLQHKHTWSHGRRSEFPHISASLRRMACYFVEAAPHGDAARTLMNLCLPVWEHMDRDTKGRIERREHEGQHRASSLSHRQ